MSNIQKVIVFATVSLIAVSPFFVFAHGLGQTFEREVGDYNVDIGYDSVTEVIPAGAPVRFDFDLSDKDRTLRVPFTTVWVRIAPTNAPGFLFAGYLGIPSFGPANMSYVFADAGSYELTVRYENKDGTLAETSFPLTVTEQEGSVGRESSLNVLLSGVIGFVLGAIILFFFRKRS